MKALFLGKFQPPHLGHIRTIIKVASEYDHVIIGITKGEPKAIEYLEVKNILNEVLSSNGNISVVLVEGTIEGGTANLSKLDFDIVVSGNHKVLDTLERQGYKVKFQPRTDGNGYSGSSIRSLMETNSIFIQNMAVGYDFRIVPTSNLRPLEKVFPSHFNIIEQLLLCDGLMRRPIIIDAKHSIVLDGSHRYAFLLKHGYQYAPVLVVDYGDDSIFVGNHLRHRYLRDENFVISKAEVISRALNEKLFPARTTRHFFPFRKRDHATTLDSLNKAAPHDVTYLLEQCTREDEIIADQRYITEINDELIVINEYIEEQKDVRQYLQYQLDRMMNSKDL